MDSSRGRNLEEKVRGSGKQKLILGITRGVGDRRRGGKIGQQYWMTGGQEERRTRGQNSMTEGQDASDREAVKNIGPPVAPVINMTNMVVFTAEIQI